MIKLKNIFFIINNYLNLKVVIKKLIKKKHYYYYYY